MPCTVNAMHQDHDESKPFPHGGIFTPEWHAFSRTLPMEERGFAFTIMLGMQYFGLSPPSAEDAAKTFGLTEKKARYLLKSFKDIPQDIIDGQLRRISELPVALVEEML